MNELIELLKRWAELEPERCKTPTEEDLMWRVKAADKDIRDEWKIIGSIPVALYWNWHDSATLQRAVQDAIVAHDLRFCVESAANGIYFAGVRGISPHSTCHIQDQEPAIALLRAYLMWLERKAEGGEG